MTTQRAIERTSDHYSRQWSGEVNFAGFVEQNPLAAQVMPGRQLGWPDLIDRIRRAACDHTVRVYDAGCGYGDVARQLLRDPCPGNLEYLGVDIHSSLDEIDAPPAARFVQADITATMSGERPFNFIICSAALHHTPDPFKTYATLAAQLASGGTLAVSVYARKTPMREAIDDAMRAMIVPMDNDAALAVSEQFTRLGRELQACEGTVTISNDLPFLGIKAGAYTVQSFIYEHFIKCWHNPHFPRQHCDLVNFDWYHPPFAFRFSADEFADMALGNGLTITRQMSISAQHYLEATRGSEPV